MYALLLLCLSANSVFSEDIKDLTPMELLSLAQDTSQFHARTFKPSDVTFFEFFDNFSAPVADDLDLERNTKIIVHGWLENHRRSWYRDIATEYLKNNVNVIGVDWEQPARFAYVYSAQATKLVGTEIANFIQTQNLSPDSIHIIGHSLGAHIAGFTGKKIFNKTGNKISRITALDPAGPYFRHYDLDPNERLDRSDAEVVDAIHTDAGFYGYEKPIGTLDIYVNGGQRIQPGCLDEWASIESLGDFLENSFCSHARSTKYFTEWIDSGKFKCRFCQPVSGINLLGDRCSLHHVDLILGSEDVDGEVTGICFARTNRDEPYLA